MSSNTLTVRNSSSPNRPLDPRRRHRSAFAREATADAFGQRGAEVLDQGDFIDRLPGRMLVFPTKARAR